MVGVGASHHSTTCPLLWYVKVPGEKGGWGSTLYPTAKRWHESSQCFLHPWYQWGSVELSLNGNKLYELVHFWWEKPRGNWNSISSIYNKAVSQHSTFAGIVSTGPKQKLNINLHGQMSSTGRLLAKEKIKQHLDHQNIIPKYSQHTQKSLSNQNQKNNWEKTTDTCSHQEESNIRTIWQRI